ncbi:unnamed protein product [Spodoptera exigua]|nr:unnamed protein product [Spodoptera exigua]
MNAKKECDEKSEKQDVAKPETQSPAQAEEESALKELLQVEEKYVPLITLLEKFSPGEDGILLNKKLRHFETTISSLCPEERLVQEAFATIRAAALQSPVTARKLAAVSACFNSQPHLRRVFLNVVLQETFNKLDILERSDPRYLVNAANIMGDYFAKARLSNGQKVDFLAEPLLQYMRALLASQDIRAHRSLATQLMVNGRELMSALPQELDELTVSIRVRLLSPPPVSPTWLLLSADLCLNQFHPLPSYVSSIEVLVQQFARHFVSCSWDIEQCSPVQSLCALKRLSRTGASWNNNQFLLYKKMGKGVESFVWSVEVELSDIDAKKECDEKSEKQDIAKPETQSPAQAEEESALKELLQVEEKYVPLITLLEKFSPGEDGILLNKKLRHFEATISSMCPEERLVQEAFATIRAAALQSPVTAHKLAAVGACFNSQPHLRRVFLNVVLQETFNKLDILERSDPRYLVNAANIMGDYFAKARLSNGKKVDFLAEPLLQYMRALLASQDIRAHRSLATQLMVNGRELMAALPQELDELTVSIRVRLLSPPPDSTTWLLLSADLCLNQFHLLPSSLQKFYASHLELS